VIPSLTGIHFLITYGCSAECDHCFIWGSPRRDAHMTAEQIEPFLDEIVSLGTVTDVCAEGGEPFTRYDVMMRFLRAAKERGLNAGALTNAFWVRSREHAEKRVTELMAAGLSNLGVSTDEWHRKSVPAERADTLARGLRVARPERSAHGVKPGERHVPRTRRRAARRLRAAAAGP
jgi:pyruvate-formate lyase-activating enzyme